MEDNIQWIALGGAIAIAVCVAALFLLRPDHPAVRPSRPGSTPSPPRSGTKLLTPCVTVALRSWDGPPGIAGWLVTLGGVTPFATFVLHRSGDTTIGRSPDCGIVLNDVFVSGKHARVVGRSGYFLIENELGVINPVKVDGEVVSRPTMLRTGMELQIGDTRLAFLLAGPTGSIS